MRLPSVTRNMHKFSTAATKSSGVRCAPLALYSVGLLNVLQRVRLWGPPLVSLARSSLSSLRDKNLCIIRAALLLLFLSSFTFGQIFSPDETVSRITDNLMCTCGCPHSIGHCGEECPVAPQLVHEISELVTAGNTEEEVYQIFEEKYGLRVRAVPLAEGFNLLVWVMPFVGLLAGVVVIFFVINRLKPDDSNQETERVHSEIDEKYRRLIDREMER